MYTPSKRSVCWLYGRNQIQVHNTHSERDLNECIMISKYYFPCSLKFLNELQFYEEWSLFGDALQDKTCQQLGYTISPILFVTRKTPVCNLITVRSVYLHDVLFLSFVFVI